MKAVLSLVTFIAFIVCGQAQSPGLPSPVGKPAELLKALRIPRSNLPIYNRTGIPVSSSVLKKPAALREAIRGQEAHRSIHAAMFAGAEPRDAGCSDSSMNKLIGLENCLIYMNTIWHTRDDGVLIGGSIIDSTTDMNVYNGFLLKTDRNGNVLWTRVFANGNEDSHKIVSVQTIFQLQSGDIVLAGSIDSSGTGYNTGTFLLRLDESGNRRWYRTYVSDLAKDGQGLDIKAVSDGLNGDLLLAGTTSGSPSAARYCTTIRMDADGNILWDNSYSNDETLLPAEGVSVGMQNGEVVSAGLCNRNEGGQMTPAAEFIRFEYSTGRTIAHRVYAPDVSSALFSQGKQFSGYAHAAFQKNGHIIFYANLLSGTGSLGLPYDHFGVLEVDEQLSLLSSYSITSLVPGYLYSSNCFFDAYGNGAFYVLSYTDVNYGTDYSGVVQNGNLMKERVSVYSDAGVGSEGTYGQNFKFCFMDDGAFLQSSTYYKDNSSQESFLEFKKMHLSDTSSSCLGHDSLFAWQLPFPLYEPAVQTGTEHRGDVVPANYVIKALVDAGTYTLSGCRQNNFCDTLRIHGDSVLCDNGAPQVFTAFRNAACGGMVHWDFDTAVVAGLQYLSDTSVTVSFRPYAGRTWVRASLPGGQCRLNPVDSISLKIISPPAAVNLGNDTLVCNGLPFSLIPGDWFKDLLWQDGTTANTLLVSRTGIFSVLARDVCGNQSKDTVAVSFLSVPEIALGSDTTVCPGQPFTLSVAGDSSISWLWQDGSSSRNYTVSEPGLYRVTATNRCGTTEGRKSVSAGACRLLLPNVFSPNGDGLNDLFRVRNPIVTAGFNLQVFDRWGQLVFLTSDISQGWNGRRSGELQPAGTYVWMIRYTDQAGKEVHASGTVLLIR